MYGSNKRKCRRFDIPGAEGRYKKKDLLVAFKGFSDLHYVVDISKGGMSFYSDKKFSKGKKLIVQIVVSDEILLTLNAVVRRQEKIIGSSEVMVGVQFLAFNDEEGYNTEESLNILRELDRKYG